jgi:hypothetical protein
MVSAEVVRTPSMAAHAWFSPAARKSCGQAATFCEGRRIPLTRSGTRGWDPSYSTSAVGRAVVEARRSATLHDHPLTPEV